MSKSICFFFFSAAIVFFGQLAVFSESADLEAKLQEGIKLHDAARIDPEANIKKGEELLSSIQAESPIAKAYYGSIITLEASEYAKKKDVLKALELLSDGTKLIDAAVTQSPDIPDIRFLRMENSYEVSQSSPLNRYKAMKQDVDWLDAHKTQFEAKERGIIELYKGFYYVKAKKIDDALSAFDACIEISPKSKEAVEAQKQIDRYAE